MARKIVLSPSVIKLIHDAIDRLFNHAKVRLLGSKSVDKRIYIGYTPRLTLPGLFEAASTEERNLSDQDVLKSLMTIAEGYLETQRLQTKTQVMQAVQSFLQDQQIKETLATVGKVLDSELKDIWKKTTAKMTEIVNTEATIVRNTATLDGIVKVNQAHDIDDPLVAFLSVNDTTRCEECTKIHTIDGSVPRVWRLSEVSHSYHKRGQDHPAIGGLHPNCRCSLITVLPGYGFSPDGRIAYVGKGHDEFKKQKS